MRRRKRFGRRGVVSSGMVLLVLLIGMGAFLAYENTLPTTVKANVKDGQKDLPTDSTFVMRFSRSISIEAVKRAFSVTPVTDGSISAISGQTDYAWTPNKPLAELTSYTVSFKATSDTTH
ncbi:MAG TPA: Ig-like domain-containing protein, partial [Candidatus Dormibacteraeota bacterium]|nr:Ig-like domain-containing protein [Candidatus Dormibacteraeota bacterium]